MDQIKVTITASQPISVKVTQQNAGVEKLAAAVQKNREDGKHAAHKRKNG